MGAPWIQVGSEAKAPHIAQGGAAMGFVLFRSEGQCCVNSAGWTRFFHSLNDRFREAILLMG
jgi:hypothetical protein